MPGPPLPRHLRPRAPAQGGPDPGLRRPAVARPRTLYERSYGKRGRPVDDPGRLLQLAARARRHAAAGRGRRADPPAARWTSAGWPARLLDRRGADLAQVGLRHPRRRSTSSASSASSQEKRTRARQEGRYAPLPIDVLLATNMISVGVDVQRLGLMVVAGQPKTTAEYIQATSRVGRARSRASCSPSTTGRARATCRTTSVRALPPTFYQHVEALSVTPFAPRALDRGLTGVLVSLLRLSGPEWNDEPAAPARSTRPPRERRRRRATRSASAPTTRSAQATAALDARIVTLLDAWSAEAAVGQRNLVYQRRGKSDADVGLLQEPGLDGWWRLDVPTSLRDVEPAVPLALRPRGIAARGRGLGRAASAPPTPPEEERVRAREPRRRAAPEPAPAHLRRRRRRSSCPR